MFNKNSVVLRNLHFFINLIFILRHSFYGSVFFISKVSTLLFIYLILKYISSPLTVISFPLVSEFSFITCKVTVTNQQLLSSTMKIRTSDDHISLAFVFKKDIKPQLLYLASKCHYPELYYVTFR